MSLADSVSLRSEHVQLLADGIQPVYVLELTPIAETLNQLGLLRLVRYVYPYSERPCLALETTAKGRAYVAAWIDQHSKEALPCDAPLAELSPFQKAQLSVLVGAALAL